MASLRTGSATERATEARAASWKTVPTPADGPAAGLEVPDVALDELEIPGDPCQVLRLPGREVVEDADLVAPPDQGLGDVRADEARSAGDQIPRHACGS